MSLRLPLRRHDVPLHAPHVLLGGFKVELGLAETRDMGTRPIGVEMPASDVRTDRESLVTDMRLRVVLAAVTDPIEAAVREQPSAARAFSSPQVRSANPRSN